MLDQGHVSTEIKIAPPGLLLAYDSQLVVFLFLISGAGGTQLPLPVLPRLWGTRRCRPLALSPLCPQRPAAHRRCDDCAPGKVQGEGGRDSAF